MPDFEFKVGLIVIAPLVVSKFVIILVSYGFPSERVNEYTKLPHTLLSVANEVIDLTVDPLPIVNVSSEIEDGEIIGGHGLVTVRTNVSS